MGKGSHRRKEDFKKVQDNWDSINWGDKNKSPWDKFSDELIEKYPEIDNLSDLNTKDQNKDNKDA